jgi:hypothetical protein
VLLLNPWWLAAACVCCGTGITALVASLAGAEVRPPRVELRGRLLAAGLAAGWLGAAGAASAFDEGMLLTGVACVGLACAGTAGVCVLLRAAEDRGDDDHRGGGGEGPDPPDGPSDPFGPFDWDDLEAEFRAYAQRQRPLTPA